MMKWTWWNNKD